MAIEILVNSYAGIDKRGCRFLMFKIAAVMGLSQKQSDGLYIW